MPIEKNNLRKHLLSNIILIILHPSKGGLSSAGSEHLPYKQRVTGSNPVAPTHKTKGFQN